MPRLLRTNLLEGLKNNENTGERDCAPYLQCFNIISTQIVRVANPLSSWAIIIIATRRGCGEAGKVSAGPGHTAIEIDLELLL